MAIHGHVSELLARQISALEVVLGLDEWVVTSPFFRPDQTYLQLIEDGLCGLRRKPR